MSHTVIPATVRFDAGGRGFAFRPGTAVRYADTAAAPVAERFCAQITRRTGLRLAPAAGSLAPDEPGVTIELASGDDLRSLPAPTGLSPASDGSADERYSLMIDGDQVVVRAAKPIGVARGLTTLIQLVAATPPTGGGEIRVPGTRIVDAPRYAWRGLSLDVARAFFTVAEIRRVIDLLELYKLNVLHLHLTDDESWRLPIGQATGPEPDAAFYSGEDLQALVRYAADRFVTVVPEVDTPGHAAALIRLHPDLDTGRNDVEWELIPGSKRRARWLDPELPATFELIEQVLAGVTAIFPGPYLHIGGDEPRGMPHDLYAAYVQRLRGLVRLFGKRPLGWQESARALARTTSSSTGSPTPPFQHPCRRRSERSWTRSWRWRAARRHLRAPRSAGSNANSATAARPRTRPADHAAHRPRPASHRRHPRSRKLQEPHRLQPKKVPAL